MKTKDIIIILLVAVVAILGTYIFMQTKSDDSGEMTVTNFDECVAAGGPVMESYPEQCRYDGKTFVNEIDDNEVIPPAPPAKEEKLIGGDRDEHGCIGSAGYSWCEAKGKCLRSWEEECEDEDEAEDKNVEDVEKGIISALAAKHNKNHADVSITIEKEVGDYIKGMVQFEQAGEVGNAGMFLATKVNGNWVIVYDGHGMADCDDLINNYGFPKSVLQGICE